MTESSNICALLPKVCTFLSPVKYIFCIGPVTAKSIFNRINEICCLLVVTMVYSSAWQRGMEDTPSCYWQRHLTYIFSPLLSLAVETTHSRVFFQWTPIQIPYSVNTLTLWSDNITTRIIRLLNVLLTTSPHFLNSHKTIQL